MSLWNAYVLSLCLCPCRWVLCSWCPWCPMFLFINYWSIATPFICAIDKCCDAGWVNRPISFIFHGFHASCGQSRGCKSNVPLLQTCRFVLGRERLQSQRMYAGTSCLLSKKWECQLPLFRLYVCCALQTCYEEYYLPCMSYHSERQFSLAVQLNTATEEC